MLDTKRLTLLGRLILIDALTISRHRDPTFSWVNDLGLSFPPFDKRAGPNGECLPKTLTCFLRHSTSRPICCLDSGNEAQVLSVTPILHKTTKALLIHIDRIRGISTSS